MTFTKIALNASGLARCGDGGRKGLSIATLKRSEQITANRWHTVGALHKGWMCVDVIDLLANGEPVDETDYATRQMCGNEKIRYVHVMVHPGLD